MKTVTKIWCNSNYMKNSVRSPNGGLLKRTLKCIINYCDTSLLVGHITKILMLL